MKKRDYSTLLIYAAAGVTMARYIGAFIASDVGRIDGIASDAITILMGITGIGMGLLDTIGTAYIFTGWRSALPKAGGRWSSRFIILTGFVVLLFLAGMSILIPFTVSRVMQETMSAALFGKWGVYTWALAVNVAPFLIIGGAVAAHPGFVGVYAEHTTSIVPHDAEPIHALPSHVCEQCGASFEKSVSLAAHVRWQHPKVEVSNVIN